MSGRWTGYENSCYEKWGLDLREAKLHRFLKLSVSPAGSVVLIGCQVFHDSWCEWWYQYEGCEGGIHYSNSWCGCPAHKAIRGLLVWGPLSKFPWHCLSIRSMALLLVCFLHQWLPPFTKLETNAERKRHVCQQTLEQPGFGRLPWMVSPGGCLLLSNTQTCRVWHHTAVTHVGFSSSGPACPDPQVRSLWNGKCIPWHSALHSLHCILLGISNGTR